MLHGRVKNQDLVGTSVDGRNLVDSPGLQKEEPIIRANRDAECIEPEPLRRALYGCQPFSIKADVELGDAHVGLGEVEQGEAQEASPDGRAASVDIGATN